MKMALLYNISCDMAQLGNSATEATQVQLLR